MKKQNTGLLILAALVVLALFLSPNTFSVALGGTSFPIGSTIHPVINIPATSFFTSQADCQAKVPNKELRLQLTYSGPDFSTSLQSGIIAGNRWDYYTTIPYDCSKWNTLNPQYTFSLTGQGTGTFYLYSTYSANVGGTFKILGSETAHAAFTNTATTTTTVRTTTTSYTTSTQSGGSGTTQTTTTISTTTTLPPTPTTTLPESVCQACIDAHVGHVEECAKTCNLLITVPNPWDVEIIAGTGITYLYAGIAIVVLAGGFYLMTRKK